MGGDIVAYWMMRIIAAVLLTFVLAWAVRRPARLLRRGIAWLERRLQRRGRGLEIRRVEVLSPVAILAFAGSLVGTLRVFLTFALFYSWLLGIALCLDASQRVSGVIVQPFAAMIMAGAAAFLSFVPRALMIVVIFTLARFATRVVVLLSGAVAEGRLELQWLDPELVTTTRRMAKLFIWMTAVVLMVPYLPGSDSPAFMAVAVTAAVVLSLGSTSVSANLLSGLMLTYVRAFRVGDQVTIGDKRGEVTRLGPFMTRLRGPSGEEVLIPNAVVQRAPIINWTPAPPPAPEVPTMEPGPAPRVESEAPPVEPLPPDSP